MADTNVAITAGAGTNIDAQSVPGGDLQQTVTIGDGANAGRVAKLNVLGDQIVSLTNPTALGGGIYASINPYGGLRASVEPSVVFFDPFDGSVIDTNRWTAAGTQVPTQSAGSVTLAPTIGASVNNNSTLISTANFLSPGLGFILYAGVVTLEAAQTNVVNVHRFWGKGQVTSYAYATPVTDGMGFEVEGSTGALQCVVYVAGTKYVINGTTASLISSSISGAGGSGTALPTGVTGTNYGTALTWKGGPHRYAIFARSDGIYWFAENQDLPVAACSYLTPAVQSLPSRAAAITNGAATSLANTFQLGAWSVCDSTAGNSTLSDGTYPHRKGNVGKSGGLSVKGASITGQTLAVTAATPITGTGLDVSEAGNCTFIVKNTVAATAFTGVPVIVFEQSDDNVSWAPLPVSSAQLLGTMSATPTIATGVASTSQMFDAGLEGVNWVRVRVVTAQATNGMTVLTQPGGMPFNPSVNTATPSFTVGTATGTIFNARAAPTTATTASLQAAPAAGLALYITDVSVSNSGTTLCTVSFLPTAGTSLLDVTAAANGGGGTVNFKTPLRITTATALSYTTSAASTTVFITATGYTAA